MVDTIKEVVQFDVVTNINDAVTKTKQLQEIINKLKLTPQLEASFLSAFTKIEQAGAKAGAAFSRGLKDKKDINDFNNSSKKQHFNSY